jgi:Phage protein Gp68
MLNAFKPKQPEREWSTSDPSLHDGRGAHETSAVLRMHRAGWTGVQMAKLLGIMCGPPLTALIKRALDQETDATRKGLPIYDSRVSKGKYVRAKEVVKGDGLVEHGSAVVDIRTTLNSVVFDLEDGKRAEYRPNDELLVHRAV